MKRWLKKWLPTHDAMHQSKNTRWIANWLRAHPYLWALNRKNVAKGVAAGLLVAFIPIPLQILLASLLALLIRANLPIAIASTLITNPITFVPLNVLIYHIGLFLTGENDSASIHTIPALHLHWQNLSLIWQELITWVQSLGKTYLIGLVTLSVTASMTGFILVHVIWRISLWLQLRARSRKYAEKK